MNNLDPEVVEAAIATIKNYESRFGTLSTKQVLECPSALTDKERAQIEERSYSFGKPTDEELLSAIKVEQKKSQLPQDFYEQLAESLLAKLNLSEKSSRDIYNLKQDYIKELRRAIESIPT